MLSDRSRALLDIRDGTSSTLLLGESVPDSKLQYLWWYAGTGADFNGLGDSTLGGAESLLKTPTNYCPPGPYSFGDAGKPGLCTGFQFWSLHAGGANFAFADGHIEFIKYAAKPLMPALATANGGEVISDDF